MTFTILFIMFVAGMMVWVVQRTRKAARLRQERADFIRQYRFPAGLKYKLDQTFPDLSEEQVQRILDGLRAWFLLIAGDPRRHFGMPSKAVDTAWHEFILLTKSYADFCDGGFGKFLHHVPRAGDANAEQDGLAWTWGNRGSVLGAGVLAGGLGVAAIMSAKDLFGIDQQLGIAGGNAYSDADIEKLDKRHSQLASSSGDAGGSTGGDASGCGDGGSCGDGGGGGGCGGGGGGGGS